MLVVRRRAGQSILIGENIEVQVIDVSSTRVTLGIVAPKEVTLIRAEVQLTHQQNLAAAESSTLDSLAKLAGALRLR
jgi:carbon storage regulator